MSEPLSWEEEKRRAQDPLTSDLVKEFERQIREYGEIQEYGLGHSIVKDTWQKYVPTRHRDRENDPDGDGEPEG
ncbi:hypothetical protein EPA93_03960 [Ktedonosporobacter rubrisoli]|uniref:Uncharacterized protein n=1 Tax=Ktedonosporobacter rubrisoli TaxID=2509675 RepID=A0A4P6JJS1_KTERU|nr:hypothetical protein [Ktedonosporobacter rubrisoli]QBD75192.1 hypothetical protein EPA93_03960 [Ktedonosporobacter rubrisoli]